MGLQEGMNKRIGGGRYFERSSIEHKIRRESISEMKTVKKKDSRVLKSWPACPGRNQQGQAGTEEVTLLNVSIPVGQWRFNAAAYGYTTIRSLFASQVFCPIPLTFMISSGAANGPYCSRYWTIRSAYLAPTRSRSIN
jgi:hypothetical protein